MSRLHYQGIILFVAAMAVSGAQAETYYKWVDENNVTHYGERPPADKETEEVRTSTGHSEPTVYDKPKRDDEDKDAKAEEPAEEEQVQLSKKEKKEYCQRAKSNYETLNARAIVRQRDEYGNIKELSENERNQAKSRAKKAMDDYCK